MSAVGEDDPIDEGDWHEDFPEGAEALWDVVAKALMLRINEGILTFTEAELKLAAHTQMQMRVDPITGDLEFFVKRSASSEN